MAPGPFDGEADRARGEFRYTDVVEMRVRPVQPAQLGPADDAGPDQRTRDRVLRAILESGPIAAGALADRLGLTPAAVRRHLDALLADGQVEARPQRAYGSRARGRPAKVFTVTEAGRETFHHAYDDLALSALRFLSATVGPQAVLEFARAQVADVEVRYRPLVTGLPLPERARVLADALSTDGYAASSRSAPVGAGEQMSQHHCPVAHVAAEFPQLCEAETEVISRLLGTHVQRLATIANGDGICTTHISTHIPTAVKG